MEGSNSLEEVVNPIFGRSLTVLLVSSSAKLETTVFVMSPKEYSSKEGGGETEEGCEREEATMLSRLYQKT